MKNIKTNILTVLVAITPVYSFTLSPVIESHIASEINNLSFINSNMYDEKARLLIVDNYAKKIALKYKSDNADDISKNITNKLSTTEDIQNVFINEFKSDIFSFINMRARRSTLLSFNHDNKILNLHYQGLTIAFSGPRPFSALTGALHLYGIPLENSFTHTPECLSLSIGSGVYLYIDNINVQSRACPIPSQQSGTFLLGVIEALAKELGLKEIRAEDYSRLKCEKDERMASLRILKIFEKGMSWYGAHGYVYDNQQNDKKTADTLRNYDLTKIDSAVRSDRFPSIKKLWLSKMTDYIQSNSQMLLGPFMTWLWNHDCEAYNNVFEAIFSEYSSENFNELLPQHKGMVKKL